MALRFYAAAGKLAGWLLRPVIRPVLGRTSRVYALLESDGEVLLVKNWLGKQRWSLPGGGVAKRETPEQALVREVAEEVGISLIPRTLKLVAEGTWQTDRLGHNYRIYHVRLSERPKMAIRTKEVIAAEWVPARNLSRASISVEITGAAAGAGLS